VREDLNWLCNVIVALGCSGMRISELVSLRWSDVDLELHLLTLTDESGRPSSRDCKRRELKSGRSRALPIHRDLLAVLTSMERKGPYVRYGPRGGWLKDDTVRDTFVDKGFQPRPGKRVLLTGDYTAFAITFVQLVQTAAW
jgi:integrase